MCIRDRYCEASERKEYNVKENFAWKTVSKDDPRKMWKTINYKDKNSKSNNDNIDPEIVHRYFTGIFQAEHLAAKPTVADVKEELNDYSVVHEFLDEDFKYDEWYKAIMGSGRGIGIDGLEKMIAHLFPKKLRTALLMFFNKIYNTVYPDEWTYQILRPEIKKGHSVITPKLRHGHIVNAADNIRHNDRQSFQAMV